MKLSLCILKEWLAPYQPQLQTYRKCQTQNCSNDCICIENVRLYNHHGENADFSRDTLYVGRACDYYDTSSNSVVCRYTESTLLFDTDDLTSIFNEILNCFRYYEKWEQQMALLIEQGCTLTELLDLSDSILQNPLFVFDSSDSTLAYSSAYEDEDIDEAWTYLVHHKRSLPQYALSFHDSKNPYFNDKMQEPFLITSDFFYKNTYNQNLFYDTNWCGLCVMVEYRSPLNVGKMHLFKLLCNHIQRWIDHQKTNATFIRDVSLFYDLLEGKDIDLYGLSHKLQIDGWQQNDEMILLIARGISQGYNTQNYLCRIFSDISPYIYAVTYDESIVLLCDIKKLSTDTLFDHLLPWLRRSAYHCSVSNSFSQLTDIYHAYTQAKTAYFYGEKENERQLSSGSNPDFIPEEIHEVKKYILPGILEHLHTTLGDSYLHPRVLMLQKYDQQHHSAFLKTLYVYLNNERHIKKTAEELNIHRNTLLQRISRLTDYFEIDFENPNERFYMLLSIHTLLCLM